VSDDGNKEARRVARPGEGHNENVNACTASEKAFLASRRGMHGGKTSKESGGRTRALVAISGTKKRRKPEPLGGKEHRKAVPRAENVQEKMTGIWDASAQNE